VFVISQPTPVSKVQHRLPVESAAMGRARSILFTFAAFGLLLAITSAAEPVSQLRASNYVNDFARVLQPDTEAQLNNLCQQVDEKAKA